MRKKTEVTRFARWCFAQCGVKPCPITYAPGESLISEDGELSFGRYYWEDGPDAPAEIFVAYRLPKWGVMSVIAHEIWHHRQQMTVGIENMGIEASEAEAEKASEELLALWLIRGGRVLNDREN